MCGSPLMANPRLRTVRAVVTAGNRSEGGHAHSSKESAWYQGFCLPKRTNSGAVNTGKMNTSQPQRPGFGRRVARARIVTLIVAGLSWLFDAMFRFIPEPPSPCIPRPQRPVPKPRPAPAEGSFLIGTVEESKEPVYALSPQLDRHLLIVGGTGCGKTTLIARMFVEEIQKWQ